MHSTSVSKLQAGLAAAFLTLALAGSSAAQTAPSATKRFERLAQAAAAAREANRLEAAIDLYLQALRLRPAWQEGRWYLATLYYELDRYEEGRDAFHRVVERDPSNSPAWALLGLCEFRLREYDRALEHVERGRTLGFAGNEELAWVARYHAAILLTRSGKFEAAYEILAGFARSQRETPQVLEAVGLMNLRMPLLPSELQPERREMVLVAGRAGFYQAARRPREAHAAYQELAARYPKEANVHYARGVFLLAENPDAALAEFRHEVEISPAHVPARLQIAFECLKRNDVECGLPHAREAVRLAPRDFAARNALGRLLLESGDVAGAIRELEAGAEIAPTSPEMHFALSRAYARAGRKREAEKARVEFQRLDKLRRTQREGAQAVGGIDPKQPPAGSVRP
jgi:tetratricopeptide (TPR) repeat protein